MNLTIVDGNSIGYAAHHGTVLTNGEMQTQAVFGVIRTLAEHKKKHPDTEIVVCWDGKASWRWDVCPTYKSNRHSDDPEKEAIRAAYKAQGPYIYRALRDLGVNQLLYSTHEADDLAGLLVSKKRPEDTMFLLTSDKDWLQLIRPGVIWCDPRFGTVISSSNFFESTGYKTPEAFLDGKCLKGDASDAIPGVGGIGEKGAPAFLALFGSVENYFNAVKSGVYKPTKKAYKELATPEGRRRFNNNYKVMQLLQVAPIEKANQVMAGKKPKDREDFLNLCRELAFMSFLKNPDEILNLF